MKIKPRFALIVPFIYFLLLSMQARSQNSDSQNDSLYLGILNKQRLVNRSDTAAKFRLENGKYISFSRMDTFLKSKMDSIGIPGLSFALINDEQIIYHRTIGVTNIETNQPVSNLTIFDAASMTKTPFAFLVMRLAEKGILDFDKPLFTYLPHPDIAHDERYKLITARMVLSHASGFPNWRRFNEDKKLMKFQIGRAHV